MAGDWIKMRSNLWDDPRVGRLIDLTDSSEAAIVGGLYWLWSSADQHTEDGLMPGLTLRQIDRKTGIKGFGAALVSINWLVDGPEGVTLVNFEEHNGTSAKRRCTDAQRKATVRTVSASDADNSKTDGGQKAPNSGAREREEKEKYTPPNGGDAPQSAANKRGTRLPDGWVLPLPLGQWALAEYPHWTPDIVRLEADKFANHWHAKTGKDASKLDWPATWRNWCMSDICQRSHPPPGQGTETNYTRQMRERVEEATGSMAHIVAAKAPGTTKQAPWDIAIENNARTAALGMGRSGDLEADG